MSVERFEAVINGKIFTSQVEETIKDLKDLAEKNGYETQDEDVEDNSWD